MKWKYKININGVNPEKIHRTQMYIDSEIIKRSEPYVPLKTGSLVPESQEHASEQAL